MTYIGRFAPSPTGPLHFGSLVAALGSWLDARANNGQWLLRIEDLDPPREMAGAIELIIESLEKHGLYWDGAISYQSQRLARYDEILADLDQRNLTYPCVCTRRQIREQGGRHVRCHPDDASQVFATRLIVDDNSAEFDDLYQGLTTIDTAQADEDCILKRKDGLHAYMLAVVVDDIEQGISHIIRGSDLITTTCQQIYLFKALNANVPKFGHLPLATKDNGDKLSKQTRAPAINNDLAIQNLCSALTFLNQAVPENPLELDLPELLNQAVAHWQPDSFKNQQAAVVAEEYFLS